MDFLSYIGDHYEEIKQSLQKYKDFNEDVFHNTIISCQKATSERPMSFKTSNDIVRYFISSYRMNLLREHKYYHNQYVDVPGEVPDTAAAISEAEHKTDLNIILEDVKKHFPNDIFQAYYKYVTNDISISELQKQLGIKNLKAKIKAIKDYIHAQFD